jgi:MoxR-like ATPase
VTDPQKWFGRREIDSSGTRYEKSDFILAVERGDVILLDEVKRLHPTIHNPIMSLLAGDESVLLSDLNVTITRNPQTVFIATTNEGAAFGGNHRMDYAMDERFPFRVERDWPPEDDEVKILVTHNPGCDPDAASILVDIAAKTRSMFTTGDLRAPISTRTLNAAAHLVASGYSEREALSWTALGLYDAGADGSIGEKSERSQVRAVIEGRTRR